MNVEEIDHSSPKWEPLWNLFGAYLHQDLDAVHGDPWSAVAAFRMEDSSDNVAAAGLAARQLAEQVSDDAEGRRATDKLGLDYYPPADGYTYRGWLMAIADFLETGS